MDWYGVYGFVVVRTFPVCIGLMTMVQIISVSNVWIRMRLKTYHNQPSS